MCARCLQVLLVVLGVSLLGAALLPVAGVLGIPDEYRMAFISAKLLMLPIGAFCLGGAAALQSKLSRR